MRSIPEDVLCALEKNVYSAVIWWKVLYMSVRFIWSIVLFKSAISLLIFCLDVLPIVESGILKSPTIILFYCCQFFPLDLSIFRCSDIGYISTCLSVRSSLYHYIMTLFVSRDNFWLKVCLSVIASLVSWLPFL